MGNPSVKMNFNKLWKLMKDVFESRPLSEVAEECYNTGYHQGRASMKKEQGDQLKRLRARLVGLEAEAIGRGESPESKLRKQIAETQEEAKKEYFGDAATPTVRTVEEEPVGG